MKLRLNTSDSVTIYETDVGGFVVKVPDNLARRFHRLSKEFEKLQGEIRKFYEPVERAYWKKQAKKSKGHFSADCPSGGYCGNCLLDTSVS